MKKMKHFVILLCALFCSLAANAVTYELYNSNGYRVKIEITTQSPTVKIQNGCAKIPVYVSRNDVSTGYISFQLTGNGKQATMASSIQKSGNVFYLIVEYANMYHRLDDGVYRVTLLPQR